MERFEGAKQTKGKDFQCTAVVSRDSGQVVVPVEFVQHWMFGKRVPVVIGGLAFACLTSLKWFCYRCVDGGVARGKRCVDC